ncbi:MAG: hypothetical protein E7553_01835 [Ruminococcaceae bacterium]|nr:hypothetical protein [Oscillospiraceae bacterium]
MYCVQCGVKLADSQKSCPLCGTVVCHPSFDRSKAEPLFPENRLPPKPHRSLGGTILTTVSFLIVSVTLLICDLNIAHSVTWSGYVLGALLIIYNAFVLPSWFRNPNPVIFVPIAFATVVVYLLYIDLVTNGDWFLSFAFPVAGGIGLVVTAVVALLYYVKRGQLFIFGGACIALGVYLLPIEFLAKATFHVSRFIGWSLYPMNVLVLLGGFLLFLGICRPAREAMQRLFFM